MDFNLVTNIKVCYDYIQEAPIALVYYSHIPTIFISMFFGLFVFFKNRKSLPNLVLLNITFAFSIWLVLDLFLWISADSSLIMAAWSSIGTMSVIFFILCLYFVYVFIDNDDVVFWIKVFLMALVLPLLIETPTRYSFPKFDNVQCVPVESSWHSNYVYLVEFFILVWIVSLLIHRYKKADVLFKKQIVWFSFGIISFLLTFIISGYVSDYLYNAGYLWGYNVEQAGIFMMTAFLGLLAYLIVKFKAFDIKLLGTQALIVAQFVMIAAMFTFATSTTNQILIAITLLGTAIMGWFMIRSDKKLNERKEELQIMATKLSSANDQLRKLDNAKTEFISIASHQLRTPLTAIKGFISMLLEGSYGKLVPQQEDVLNKVYSSNERLVNLVEDLLNVSRMESGRMEFKLELWDMNKICQEVIDTFALRAKSCKLDLTYIKPETALPELLIDGVKVREVISNLTDNAIKYTLEGHGGVTLKLQRLGENIRVTVSDTGIGIPQTELPYLFAKFSRGKDISRLNTGGTGLGLYVGKAMIENNGGRIWAESDGQDLGSRFIIELPIKQSEELIKKWG